MKRGRLVVKGCWEELSRLGIGLRSVNREYLLDISEIAYLMFTNTAEFIDIDGSRLSLEELFSKYSKTRSDWIRFTVLLDLRLRGRKAKASFSPETLYLPTKGEETLIFVAEENSLVRVDALHQWVENAVLKGYNPIIALVDANGDVTYYSMRLQRVEDLKRWME